MSELGAAAAHPDYPMWSSLLRWSLAQGSDGTSASPQGPMSEEKRKFLEGALKAMGEDGAERQRAIFEAVQKFVDGTGDADACVDALERFRPGDSGAAACPTCPGCREPYRERRSSSSSGAVAKVDVS